MNKQYDNFSDFTNAVAALNYFNAETVKQSTSPVCVATILVRFSAFKSVAVRDALIEFIKRLFDGAEPFYEGTSTETRMYFYDRNADESDRINALLDKCVILNTYFKHYFYPNGDVSAFGIYFGIHGDDDKLTSLSFSNHYDAINDYLDINEIVMLNSKASKSAKKAKRVGKDAAGYNVYDYNVDDAALAAALRKKLNR